MKPLSIFSSYKIWLLIFLIWLTEGRKFLYKFSFQSGIIIFYLSTYWLIEVTARIFESGILLILIASLNLTGVRRLVFCFLIIVFSLALWISNLFQPGLGFV